MNLKTKRKNIERAVDLAGGIYKVAESMKISHQAIQQWIYNGHVPPKRIIKLEQLSGVTRHEIDSDLYPETLPCTAPKPPLSVRKKKPDNRAAR
jgi:DNA-binding transcriptional regulator YdaS (Cro superfamily)